MFIKPLFLIVEDDEDDRDLLKLAYEEGDYDCELVFAEDGHQAIELLQQLHTLPSIALLDINMPRMGGLDLLEKIKSSSDWRKMPVLMLSTTSRSETISQAYSMGANSYIVKPNSFRDLHKIWDAVYHFWTRTVQLPPSKAS
ncbi:MULTISPECIES: response regulator [unclassified Siphonobacter]|uniref:response regulator n=1 Tax=unclassified Siphonobacter TaxID=2635712 RepID=UPI000CC347D2|nr:MULTISPECIES: response regulator [unclassified Siphonobacter]MDQ1089218.1 CheY-like chemotaxis protein [Siphonobacter sp. SORGH_AS_1065]MDR6195391.1 CheY-like chemotaxis protein [Siphonobacter sp. SORGH_AS_0500]PKK34894.1 hypothetical protein BWI96_20015 [Siphonobacter sp. SORGH_AS_0500]